MDLRKLKSKKGFTLIELMVVIVIIGILVAIALPNFISAQDRAKVSSVKANMHTAQTTLETYAVDWSGQYPFDKAGLQNEATNKKYWKDFKNPFNSNAAAIGDLNSRTAVGTVNPTTGIAIISGVTGRAGETLYTPFDTSTTANAASTGQTLTAYNLYGVAKDGSSAVVDKNLVFTLTNG